ncbi:MAG: hypothetical protein R8G66_22955 [Cytophagales bacterium]|nr:hypothetical protein [Cytophagales bacterium]
MAMLARFSNGKNIARWVVPAMLGIVSLHVFLVWSVRFGFDPKEAVRGGVIPAILLHLLYLIIVVHAIGHKRNVFAGRLVYPAWGLVTVLGMPSTFVLPYMAWLQIPMVVTFLGGIVGLVLIRRKRGAVAG